MKTTAALLLLALAACYPDTGTVEGPDRVQFEEVEDPGDDDDSAA